MMSGELFSFVIPVHNGEATLLSCLQSIIAQTYENSEIIVIDNGSTDGSKKIITSFPDVRYVYEPNLGRSIARNAGARISRGKYICFIDCDVVLESDWLSQCEKYLQDRPIDFLATRVLPIGKKDSVVDSYRHFFADWKSHSTFLSVRKRKMFFPVINTSACVVLKDSLSDIGFFDETLKRNEDLDLSIRFFLQGFLLGATSTAQARVDFKVELSPLLRWLDYLKREVDVNKDSLFPSRAIQFIYLETIYSVLKSSHPMRLRLAGYGLLLFLCGNFGSLIQKIKKTLKKENLFLRYPLKRGKSTYHSSYENEGELYLLKTGVSFLFFEEKILYSKDFDSMGLLAVSPDLLIALRKVFKKEKIGESDLKSLQASELFVGVSL